MSAKSENVGQSKLDDLNLVKMAILRSRYGPINMQINNEDAKNKIKIEPDKEIIESKIKLFEQGYQALVEKIVNDAVEGAYSRDADINPVPIESFQIGSEKMQIIKKNLTSGSTESINAICDYSTDVQLLFYETALYYYEEALYEKSINAFIFLTMLNPQVQSFWIGLGLSYEKNLNIDKAIESLAAAYRSEPTDFSPFYGIIRCCEAIKDFSKIEEILESESNNEFSKTTCIGTK